MQRFLALFVVQLTLGFSVGALRVVDQALVAPYTAVVAKVAGSTLALLGEDVAVRGCELSSPRFTVLIYNGCNGLVVSLIFSAAVLAFPASWRARLSGLLFGLAVIQLVNQVRIVSLFYIGVFVPRLFNPAHIVVWQPLVILTGVSLWLLWAHRHAADPGSGP